MPTECTTKITSYHYENVLSAIKSHFLSQSQIDGLLNLQRTLDMTVHGLDDPGL